MPTDPTLAFDALEIAERLGASMALGAVIGLDREWRDRPAGLRTHILVALASALFTILSFELFETAQQASSHARADPIRVVEAVLTGVAFLGAGTIIRASRRLEGVTTGASIWLVGAVGIACGGGFYELALIGTAMAVLVLTGLGMVERRVGPKRRRREQKERDAEGG
ncbi:putative Mg2+ transporter-C (MgtC) family protein [Tistlia consotensis]|uniref:Protein MgtC n=1 Tax=Tistlia consotensis USBA 355 TaxID=560819 RepID=A0A1Y6B6A7_9PROT|nr:MgtC/SapB family protein [Tistlia consotensis]SME92454.1 putative Mg2+ transporter-C (MgtC) family protein [Tistlia consotensis USBA 355]SNR28039.1 putative Mg2+ transporter-C (MgtC) family protein [Tistlia consotensis]